MISLKKAMFLVSFIGILFMSMTSAQAAMVSTSEVLSDSERNQLEAMLDRQDVQHQMIELGVDPESALRRVEQMTDEELAQLNGQLTEFPAGAGVGTTELLLIIIILILLL